MIHIILFGPPGCGKGTQAKILENKFGFIHLSPGRIFRHHIKNKTSLGQFASYYINKGILVPDKITTNMLNLEMKKYIQSKGIIYDGYPRTKNQVFSLEKILQEFSLGEINIIFSFCIQKDLLINRLLKRGRISHRNDDTNIITVKRRIEEYNKETAFIWKEKKWKNNIITLNASYSVKNISLLIEKSIMKL
ncbi:MAG: nucleoside monophosphate kinase [Flavobacteriales bacterium]|jgi:adenylate kinase|uniref:nucleoside monophosphate kinase n=1 Tax=Blattabacterium sp. (Mastotermes darwiniensis) TaxID=39768 RepID=UPI00059AF1F5|nr:nucleoside monophosphate kinase [Blattabacterium sp. (Mastotermes darwiniensis)]MDR1804774.1 nucleoside monophosphate kinase [Flavobacteriales bacterium]